MPYVYHNSFYAMGTRCQVILPGMESDQAEQVFFVVKQEVNRIETILSRFIPYSEISLINRNARTAPVQVSEEIFGILKTCLAYGLTTSGAFDITIRPLLNYWKDKSKNTDADHQLYEIMDKTGMKYITLHDEDMSVKLENELVEIDLGGFGKGYALQNVNDQLKKFAVDNAFISFGESSILTRGRHPAGDHWNIGLNDYSSPGKSIYQFKMNDGSVSTSANFYVDDHGKLQNHRHVINPRMGYPIEEMVTVSVRSDSAVEAEILSTAYLAMSDNIISAISSERPLCDIVRINYTTGEPAIHVL